MSKRFIHVTLASNSMEAVIASDNVAFAIRMTAENEKHEKDEFTRVFLKQVIMDDESKWVDIKEKPTAIFK